MKRGKTGQTDHLTLVKRPENQEIPQNQCARFTTRKEINKKKVIKHLQNTIAIKKCQEKSLPRVPNNELKYRV